MNETLVFEDVMALLGDELEPHLCRRIVVEEGYIVEIDRFRRVAKVEGTGWILVPGMCNGHTHVGDSPLQDGTTGMTLEEGFFRPNGYKYRELDRLSVEEHSDAIETQLRFMLRTGTTKHLDFREQGVAGAKLLRSASERCGIKSVILSQFEESPFTDLQLSLDQLDLPECFSRELNEMLTVADGFSESTMNDLTSVAWRNVRETCHDKGKLRAIHCLENANYRSRSIEIAGIGDLRRALELYDPHLIVHLTVAEESEIELLANSGKAAVINPRANASLGLPFPPVAALMEAGVALLLGTDNVMLNCPNLLAELDFTYKVAKSQYEDARRPDPKSILKMVTTNLNGILPGVSDVGIEVGNRADFFAIDFRNPRLSGTRNLFASIVTRLFPEDVVFTICDGSVVHGEVPSN